MNNILSVSNTIRRISFHTSNNILFLFLKTRFVLEVIYFSTFNKLLLLKKKDISGYNVEINWTIYSTILFIWTILFSIQKKEKREYRIINCFQSEGSTLRMEYTLLIKDAVNNNRVNHLNWSTLSRLIEINPFKGKLGWNLLTSHASLMEKVTW